MKHITKEQSQRHQNSPACVVFEYGANSQIDGSVAEINGRYPESGWALNKISSLELFVISGSGTLTTSEGTIELQPEEVAILDSNEAYYYTGDSLKLFMAASPPWSPDQYVARA